MTYTTLTGRRIDLSRLLPEERQFLAEIGELFRADPGWDEFTRAWIALARQRLWTDGTIPVGHPVYRVCQDLATRLGVAEGRVAAPDYRDRLVDLIEERFGSRYRFCKATGIDQGHLSRVLANKKHFSPDTLFKVLDVLGVELTLVDRKELARTSLTPESLLEEGELAVERAEWEGQPSPPDQGIHVAARTASD